jgi:hypothetical protein
LKACKSKCVLRSSDIVAEKYWSQSKLIAGIP